MTCNVCGSADVREILALDDVVVHANWTCVSREEALSAPRSRVTLAFCPRCHHVFEATFDPALLSYDERYENSLLFSPRFREYTDALARNLAGRFDLAGGRIVEIGCGSGEFLGLVCRLSGAEGLGFDPSYAPGTADLPEGVTIVSEPFGPATGLLDADLVIARHVLEHIPEPVAFLGTVRDAMPEGRGRVMLEVPDARFTTRDLAIWDIIYEHCSYFTTDSLSAALRLAGFRPEAVSPAFHGQFLTAAAVGDRGRGSEVGPVPEAGDALEEEMATFADRYRTKLTRWRKRVRELGDRRRVVTWGTGSKGVTFLNAMGAGGPAAAVDINPRKRGKFVPGTGQEILAPEALPAFRPDAVILMNAVYRDEVGERMRALGLDVPLIAMD